MLRDNQEVCSHCDDLADHKIEEAYVDESRHPFSQYVCCELFGRIMGRAARNWCEMEHSG